MTSPDETTHVCEWSGQAALSLMAKLSPTEETSFREHLETNCQACTWEFEQARSAMAAMDLAEASESPRTPPRGLKQRILDAIGYPPASESMGPNRLAESAEPHSAWQSKSHEDNPEAIDGLHTRGASEGEWEPTNVAGVRTRTLRVDEVLRRVTMMVEMDPGTSYPPHRHAGTEECLVVSGDIRVGERVLQTGDFQYADAGSIHGVQSTEGGCTLLIVSSQEDALI